MRRVHARRIRVFPISTDFTPNFQLPRSLADLHNILEILYKSSGSPPSAIGLVRRRAIVGDLNGPFRNDWRRQMGERACIVKNWRKKFVKCHGIREIRVEV